MFVTGYQTLNLFCVRDMAHTSRFPSKQSLRITAIHVLNTSREAVFALTKLRLKISERTLYRYYVVERGNLWFIQRTSQWLRKVVFPLPKTWVCESHAQGSLRPAVSCCFFPAEAEYSYFSADFHMTNVFSIKRTAGAISVAFWPVLPFREASETEKENFTRFS